jgi:hypothetical protein
LQRRRCAVLHSTPQHNVAEASQTYQRRKVTCVCAHPLSKLSISVSHTARIRCIAIQRLPCIFTQMLDVLVNYVVAGAPLPFLLSFPPTPSTVRPDRPISGPPFRVRSSGAAVSMWPRCSGIATKLDPRCSIKMSICSRTSWRSELSSNHGSKAMFRTIESSSK